MTGEEMVAKIEELKKTFEPLGVKFRTLDGLPYVSITPVIQVPLFDFSERSIENVIPALVAEAYNLGKEHGRRNLQEEHAKLMGYNLVHRNN